MRRFLLAVAAAAFSILVLALAGIAFGHAPGELLGILISGSFGSAFALEGTILKSVPLLLTGLCVAIAFRAGAFSAASAGVIGSLSLPR